MYSDTLEEYKKAIKVKYEIEKEGEYFDYLHSPSRGKLRDLCWNIFEKNANQDDLNVFKNLLCLDFDHNKKNKFKEQKDKFRPIETFFKGETDPSNIDAINLAAIMVDFQPRPFKKFNEKCRIAEKEKIEDVDALNACTEANKKVIGVENLIINDEKLIGRVNENEMGNDAPKKRNLFLELGNIISKRIPQKLHPRKIATIAIGAAALLSSACIYLVQKKD